MNEIPEAPTVVDRLRGLADRFQSVVRPANGRVMKPAPLPEPTEDERLEAALVKWLSDDAPVGAVLAWLDKQGDRANLTANLGRAQPNETFYALGQESAYRAVAQRLRLIRGQR